MPYFTNRGIIPLPAGGGGAYDGPGDVYGTALVWYGLRAYSAATRGNAAIRLLKTSDGVTQADIATDATTGELNTADAFFTDGPPSGTLYSIVKIYDQLGVSANNLDIGSGLFYLVLESGRPAITSGGNNYMLSTGTIASSQPYTMSGVGWGGGDEVNLYKDNGQDIRLGTNSGGTADQFFVYGGQDGDQINATAVDDAYHAVQFLADDTGSSLYVDGVSTPGTISPINALNGIVVVGIPATGKWREVGVWAGDQSADFATVNTQQHTFWSF